MLFLDKTVDPKPFLEPAYSQEEGFIICMDKPFSWTSADVVRKIKFRLQKIWNQKKVKVGHAGTLDPLATGLLLICVGKATKASDSFQGQPKEYIAQIRFGATTPSFDLEKEIDATYPWEHIDRSLIDQILPTFLGEQMQLPPIYSAKVITGMRAYEFARQGLETPELKQAAITLYELEVLDFAAPVLTLRVVCSKGTYIRALARDLGLALHSGAHLTGLQRTRSGPFYLSQAISLQDFETFFQ